MSKIAYQVCSDFIFAGTIDYIQEQENVPPFEYTGPGYYLTDKRTLLIIPDRCEPDKVFSIKEDYKQFRAYVWDVPFNEVLLSNTRLIIRDDKRD